MEKTKFDISILDKLLPEIDIKLKLKLLGLEPL